MFTDTINLTKKISIELNSNSGLSDIPLFPVSSTIGLDYDPTLYDAKIVGRVLTKLTTISRILSLPESLPPEVEDLTELEGAIELRNWNFTSPRKQLDFYEGSDTLSKVFVGSLSFIRVDPYRRVDILDNLYQVRENIDPAQNIYLRLVDVGHGVLTGDDKISIVGSYVDIVQLVKTKLWLTVTSSPSPSPTPTPTVKNVITSPSPISVLDNEGTFTVKLSEQPNSTVIITPSLGSAPADLTPDFVQFTSDNWDVVQGIDVTLTEPISTPTTLNLQLITDSGDLNWDNLSFNRSVSVTATPTPTPPEFMPLPEVVLSGNNSTVYSATDTFTIQLNTMPPTAYSTYSLKWDTTLGKPLINPDPIDFNQQNWNVPQTITFSDLQANFSASPFYVWKIEYDEAFNENQYKSDIFRQVAYTAPTPTPTPTPTPNAGWLSTTGWIATSNAGNSEAPKAIDGNLSTYYTNGGFQHPAQYWQVDMLVSKTISKVDITEPSGNVGGGNIQISSDGVNFTDVVVGIEFNTLQEFTAVTGRYLRLQSNRSSGAFWHITEVEVYGN